MSRPALIASVLVLASCRGCLVDGVSVEDGAGGASSSTSTSVVGSTGTTTSAAVVGSSSASTSPGGSGPGTGAGGDGGDPQGTAISVSSAGGDGGATTTSSGLGGDAATSTGTGGEGGAASTAATATSTSTGGLVCPTSDDFDGVTELNECWRPVNAALGSLEVRNDELVIIPSLSVQTGWYGPTEGRTAFQTVTGDFVAGVRVRVTSFEGDYQMSGLLVRDPDGQPTLESWVKWELGLINDGDGANTPGSVQRNFRTLFGSNDDGVPDSPLPGLQHTLTEIGEATVVGTLAVCRDGDVLHTFYGAADDPAPLLLGGNVDVGGVPGPGGSGGGGGGDDDTTPELPATVEVGLTAGSFADGFSNVSVFDDFRILVAPIPDGCANAVARFYGR